MMMVQGLLVMSRPHNYCTFKSHIEVGYEKLGIDFWSED